MAKNNLNWIEGIKKLYEERNYKKALKFILEYMDKYPNSHKAMHLYLKILMKLKNFDEVELFLENNEEFMCNNKYYIYRIAIFKKDYEKAYKLLPEVIEEAKQYEVEYYEGIYMSKVYLEKQLNILDEDIDLDKLTYTEKQIVNYDENRAIEHIKKHQKEFDNKKNHTLYEPEIDLKKLFYQVQKRLPNQPDRIHLLVESYIFEYPLVENKLEKEGYLYKYIRVVTIKDTHDIITMYPIFTNKKIKEAVPLYEKKNQVKTKKLTQIEKFNRKYNM